jgi:hypothetical protein
MEKLKQIDIRYITIQQPIYAVGREFIGGYIHAAEFAEEVQRNLAARGIHALPMSVLSVFFNDPSVTPENEQKSFQAALVEQVHEVSEPYQCIALYGNYILAKTVGPHNIAAAYQALSVFAEENRVKFAEPFGYQVMTFPDNIFTVEILYKLADENQA